MFTPWQWLVFFNFPFLFVNLLGMYMSAFLIIDVKMAKKCYWLNVCALLMSVANILSNSYEVIAR